jgi:uncharacterized membrane protein YgaE (UPF0421/DUF939 family)
METQKNKPGLVSKIDIQIALAAGICLLIAPLIPEFQAMTACITVLLCVQDSAKTSWKAGIIRLIVTAAGGLAAVLVILIDNAAGNSRVFIIMTAIGLIITLAGCKLARVPLFNARIGGVTFILVVLTKSGTDRIYYAIFRLLSTFYGIIVVMAVSVVFAFFTNRKPGGNGAA